MEGFPIVLNKLKFIKLDKLVSFNHKECYNINIRNNFKSLSGFIVKAKLFYLKFKINAHVYYLVTEITKLYVSILSFLNASIGFKSFTNRVNKRFLLHLNFKRNRYFPQLLDFSSKNTIFNASLGVVSRYFSKKKNFLRSKSSYVLLSTYVRRLLINIKVLSLDLKITGLPVYLNTLIKSVLSPSNSLYKDPFGSGVINENSDFQNSLKFNYVYFFNNKFFGFKSLKTKKKGRLKRKISKKIVFGNSIID